MQTLPPASLLDLWDRSRGLPTARRALALIAAACPETSPDTLARLSIGRRDGLLLDLRERTFGSSLVSYCPCPACGERLEMSFEVEHLRVPTHARDAEPLTVEKEGWRVEFRLPDSYDFAALQAASDPGEGAQMLLERCVLTVQREGEPMSPLDLLPELVEVVAGAMDQADPQANVQIALTCPACGEASLASFDIPAFLWEEMDAWAKRTLREVHVLASAYGWSEGQVLELTASRRQLYLEMVGA